MSINLRIHSSQISIPGFRSLLEAVSSACRQEGISFFLVGATARDLLLEHVHGMPALRATQDVDVAIAVSGWKQYEKVTGGLVQERGYRRLPQPHRLVSPDDALLDIIPYGAIEQPPGKVRWPPDQAFVMTTLGFEEAYRSAVILSIDGDLPLRVASLAGVGVLKLVAWSERPHDRKRDAEDLCLIMTSYYDVVGDALYTGHLDVFDEEPFDRDQTSCRIYGRDVAQLLKSSDPLRKRLLRILEDQLADEHNSMLALAMGAGCMLDYARRLAGLRSFQKGIVERLDSDKG